MILLWNISSLLPRPLSGPRVVLMPGCVDPSYCRLDAALIGRLLEMARPSRNSGDETSRAPARDRSRGPGEIRKHLSGSDFVVDA